MSYSTLLKKKKNDSLKLCRINNFSMKKMKTKEKVLHLITFLMNVSFNQ